MRVAERKHIATARHSTNHVSPIPNSSRLFENIGNIKIFLDRFCYCDVVQSFFLISVLEFLILPVESMSDLFQQDKSIGVATRVLPLCDNTIKNLIYISHIKITAQ